MHEKGEFGLNIGLLSADFYIIPPDHSYLDSATFESKVLMPTLTRV